MEINCLQTIAPSVITLILGVSCPGPLLPLVRDQLRLCGRESISKTQASADHGVCLKITRSVRAKMIDPEERLALDDALRSLRLLLREAEPKQESDDKDNKGIA